ncbi:MAG: hypothetical protein LBS40_07700 [Burkholderiales bacterium]|jgi:CSLREA domain-containing protein|nr:hypothetical protein [Burkholderiales bacterium]
MKRSAVNSSIEFDSALYDVVFDKKSMRHQKLSMLACWRAGDHKKYWLSAFAAAMLCMGVAAQAATITVTSAVDALNDSGKCTLRGAVSSVNAGSNQNNCVAVISPDAYGNNDTITFDAAVFNTATIIDVTASGEIGITRSLTINGLLDSNGDPLVALDGKLANRILNVTSAVHLAVSGLTFRNGRAWVVNNNNGGAIFAFVAGSAVTVNDSVFIGNRADNNGGGGAIFAYQGVTIHVSNSIFTGNQASFTGGAVSAFGPASINGSTFRSNRVTSNGGAVFFYYPGGVAGISNSIFDDNRAGWGGAFFVGDGTANIDNSTFRDNQTLISSGGAIYIYASGVLNINGSVFNDNRSADYGGAIRAAGSAVAAISNSTFSGNQAGGDYGGVIAFTGNTLRASHLTLLDNSATTSGAAIYYQGSVNGSIDNSLILSSVALVGATALCAVDGAGSLGGSYNIEWVDGTDTTSCGGVNNVPGGSGAIGAIVETMLADNGGPTPTLALPAGSPAIGAVDPGGTTSQMLDIDFSPTPVTATWVDATLDQRGIVRAAAAADRSIGAFEYKAPPPPPVNGATSIPVLPAPLALLLALGLAGIGFRKLKVARR